MFSAVGCQFYCGNKECKAFFTGFNINGAWPLGKIDEVIRILKEEYGYEDDDDVLKALEDRKANGITVAAIPIQTKTVIEMVGIRKQVWCDKCRTIWDNDDVTEKPLECCPKCEGKLRDFNDLLENGIDCPYCEKPLMQERYYSKEENKDEQE